MTLTLVLFDDAVVPDEKCFLTSRSKGGGPLDGLLPEPIVSAAGSGTTLRVVVTAEAVRQLSEPHTRQKASTYE